MKKLNGVFLIPIAILVIFIFYYLFTVIMADDIQTAIKKGKPIGIRVAMINEKTDTMPVLAQMILFPEYKQICFFFVSTDALYEEGGEPINKISPSSADNFYDYTGIRSSYYIYITNKNAARLMDLIGGVDFFVEKPVVFINPDFQFPSFIRKYSGAQAVEYITSRVKTNPKTETEEKIKRLFRQESMILTVFYRFAKYHAILSEYGISEKLYSWFRTDIEFEKMPSLIRFLTEKNNVNVIELPLKTVEHKGETDLIVNEDSAKIFFDNYKEKLRTGILNKDSFSVEVLNGTEIPRLARRVRGFFQGMSVVVLSTGNFDYKPFPRTIILERSGNTYFARRLASKTSVKPKYVFFSRRATQVDLSFILGADFKIRQLKL